MYKNQLQELAQRSCFNLPSYACVREGPDHAPRFKASVNFNGEIFHGPSHCTTLRQAEHAAAEAALANLSSRAPSRSLAARVLDETGVYKNLLQETTHRAGLRLPVYTTVRSGPGHQPVFTSTVELAGMCVAGESAKTKKQAEKNAAMSAWSVLNQMSFPRRRADGEGGGGEERDQRRNAAGCSSRWFRQQWRSLDPPPDIPLINPSNQLKKKSSFLPPSLPSDEKLSNAGNSLPPAPRTLSAGGFRIAPAVQIRSVIPVCAAPPAAGSGRPPAIPKKETEGQQPQL